MTRSSPKNTVGTTVHAIRTARQLTRPQRRFLLRLLRHHVSTTAEASIAGTTAEALDRRRLVVVIGHHPDPVYRLTSLGTMVAQHCGGE